MTRHVFSCRVGAAPCRCRARWGFPAGQWDKARRELQEFIGPNGLPRLEGLVPFTREVTCDALGPVFGGRPVIPERWGDRPRTYLGGGYVIH